MRGWNNDKKSEYICNLCGAKTSTDEIINNKASANIYGLYFATKAEVFTVKPVWECNIHICEECLNALVRLKQAGAFLP